MTLTITNRQPTEYTGAVRVVFATVDIQNYDSSGESFPKESLGFNRIQRLDVTPLGGDVCSVGYDEQNEVLFLDIADGENISLKVEAKGR